MDLDGFGLIFHGFELIVDGFVLIFNGFGLNGTLFPNPWYLEPLVSRTPDTYMEIMPFNRMSGLVP